MPATRKITAYCLWRTLLVTFILYAVDGIASVQDGAFAFGCEQEIKTACLEPDSDDTPVTLCTIVSKQPVGPVGDGQPVRTLPFARTGAECINHIRAPPTGHPSPA